MLALDAVVGRETEGHDPRVAQRVADRHDVELDGEAFGQRRWGRKLVGRERLEREPLARQVRRGDELPRAVGLPGRRHGRSEERRVGNESVSTRRSRWSPYQQSKKNG